MRSGAQTDTKRFTDKHFGVQVRLMEKEWTRDNEAQRGEIMLEADLGRGEDHEKI